MELAEASITVAQWQIWQCAEDLLTKGILHLLPFLGCETYD